MDLTIYDDNKLEKLDMLLDYIKNDKGDGYVINFCEKQWGFDNDDEYESLIDIILSNNLGTNPNPDYKWSVKITEHGRVFIGFINKKRNQLIEKKSKEKIEKIESRNKKLDLPLKIIAILLTTVTILLSIQNSKQKDTIDRLQKTIDSLSVIKEI